MLAQNWHPIDKSDYLFLASSFWPSDTFYKAGLLAEEMFRVLMTAKGHDVSKNVMQIFF